MTSNWMPEIRWRWVTRPRRTSGGGEVPERNNGFMTRRPRCCLCCYLMLTLSRHQAEGESLIHLKCLKAGKEWNSSRGLRGAVGSKAAL